MRNLLVKPGLYLPMPPGLILTKSSSKCNAEFSIKQRRPYLVIVLATNYDEQCVETRSP
ncbi:hypothetical protein [Microcoleus vaginatus]|uniref:hypothetical protein n=1 Tax=Microcoleus vaginatus TaxID=119532 RepID=UPI0032ADD361